MASLGGDQVLLFGGEDGSYDDETWVYDLSDNTWTQKSPAAKPSARYTHAMASLGGDQVLLFGGYDGSNDDETWVYDLSDNTWTLKSPATKPSARVYHAMTSLGGDQVLLFGGNDGPFDDETWVYTATPAPVTKPFVLLADEDVEINGQVNSDGDIHANNDIFFNEGNKSQHTGNLTAVDDIIIKMKNKIIGTAAGDEVENDGEITGAITEDANIAAVPLPILPDIAHGDDDIAVEANKTRTLVPGDYGEVKVEKGGKFKLSSGTYNLECLELGEKSVLSIDLSSGLPIVINVDERLKFFKKVTMKLIPSTALTSLITFNIDEDAADGDNVVLIGDGSKIFGSFIAPDGTVEIGLKARLKGAVCAENIRVLKGARFVHHSSTAKFPKEFEESEVASDQSSVISYQLEQNYPNPFWSAATSRFAGNPSTAISFTLPEAGEVSLAIYNMNGQLVKRLVAGEMYAGYHSIRWDAKDERGAHVASGVYVYMLKAGDFTAQRKLVLMK